MNRIRTGWILALGLSILAARASLLDTNFNTGSGAAGIVETVLQQPDGKILVCGNFTSFEGSTNGYIVRLNEDGSLDSTFSANVSYWVRTMALQSDGKIVIGGYFTSVGNKSRNLIARINSDGSLDTTFDPGIGASGTLGISIGNDPTPFIFATAIQPDGKILITGNFTNYNGENINGICRLNTNGTRDTNFDVGPGISFGSWGRSLHVETNSQIMLTGWFTSYNNHDCNRMALINSDGSPDTTFNPNFGYDSAVYDSLALSNGDFLVVGDTESNVFTARVARLLPDGAFDSTFVGSDDDKTESVRMQTNGQILIGGYFSTVDGQSRTSIARLNPDGSLDNTFNAVLDNFVWDLCVQSDGKILASGGFAVVDGVTNNGLARFLPYTNYVETGGGGGTGVTGTNSTVTNHDGLTIETSGLGHISPNLADQTLKPGIIYTITATPEHGYIFAGWGGNFTNTTSTLRFAMASNLVLEANFIPDPYPTNAGTYYSLFYDTAAVSNANAGWLTFTMGVGGGYSARMVLDGTARAWSGKFSPELAASNTMTIKGKTVQVSLQLVGQNTVTGLVSGVSFSSSLTGYRPSAITTNYAGLDTVLLPPGTNGGPAGDGYLSLDAAKTGHVSIVGMLADGVSVSANSVIAASGMIPFYVNYSGTNAAAFGWLDLAGTNLSGTIYWQKNVHNGTNFSTISQAVGGPYVRPAGGSALVDWTNGVISASGGDLAYLVTNNFTLRGSSGAVFTSPNTNHFSITLNPVRGIFSGTFKDPSTARQAAFHGVVLQKEAVGAGFFISASKTGLIGLTNAASVSP